MRIIADCSSLRRNVHATELLHAAGGALTLLFRAAVALHHAVANHCHRQLMAADYAVSMAMVIGVLTSSYAK